MKDFNYITIFIIIVLLIEIKSDYYLSLQVVTIDDCIRNVNISNGFVIWKFDPPSLDKCDFQYQNIYPEYLTKYYNYQLGTEIRFEFQDSVHIDAFVNIKVFFNEFIIKASDNKFWSCKDCYTNDGNYIWNSSDNRMDLREKSNSGYNYYSSEPILFHCYFKINSYDDLNNYNFEVNHEFYSLNDKKYFYHRIYYTQKELELINFNNTENFYVTDNKTLSIDCTNFYFKIIYLNSFEGKLNAFGLNNNPLELGNNYDFKVSKNKGISYILTDNEINSREVTIKVSITVYNNPNKNNQQQVSKETEFNFIITIYDDIETTLPIVPTTEPIIPTTQPIIPTTQPIIPSTIPIIPSTILIIPSTQSINPSTQSIIPTTIPIIQSTEPIILTTIPIIPTTIPIIPKTEPIIKTTNPLITQKIIHCLDEDQFISYDYKNKIYFHICPTYNTEEILENINEIVNKIDIDKNYKIQGQNYIAQVSPINYLDPNKNNAIFAPLTYVNFTECEKILRIIYQINPPRKITFIEIQTNNTVNDILVNEIDYQAYDDEKNFLNLSLCNTKTIKVHCTIKEELLDEIDLVNAFKAKGIDILDINDPFFNDICYPYSESGKDLTLNDRIEEIYKNYTFCEKNCEIDKIDFENKTISCICTIKSNFTVKDLNFNLNEYKLEKKKSNFKITKCLNKLGSLKDNLDNSGFWIFLGLFVLNILLLICFCCLGIKPLEVYLIKEMADNGYIKKGEEGHAFCHNYIKKLDMLMERLNEMKKNFNNNNKKEGNAPPKHKTHIVNVKRELPGRKKTKIKTHIVKSNKDLEKNIDIIKKRMDKTKKLTFKNVSKIPLRQSTRDVLIHDTKRSNIKKITDNYENKLVIKEKSNNNDFELNLININLNDLKKRVFIPYESKHILNIYDYNDAIKYEKRSLCRIYYIFLIAKQIIMHVIFYNSPIEPIPFRISLLISVFQSDLALNAFFYTDDRISQNHKSAKNIIMFAFTNNLIVILLSTLIGYIFLTFFNNLNNTTNEIRKLFRKEEEKIKNDKKYIFTIERKKEILLDIKKIMRKFKIKVIIFYIVEILIMIFFWYYSTIFCFVYNKTQISWLIDTLVSILARIIIDLVVNILFSFLYKCSVNFKISFLFSAITCYYCFS